MRSNRLMNGGPISAVIRHLGFRQSKNPYKHLTTAMSSGRKGCVPIYVGEECKRFEVPVKLLSLPEFQKLFKQFMNDDDFLDPKIEGPLVLDCRAEFFDSFLKFAKEKLI